MAKFEAKYKGKCSSGHPVNVGDLLTFSYEGITCEKCDDPFEIKEHEPIYSEKFCPVCFLELSLTGECGNC